MRLSSDLEEGLMNALGLVVLVTSVVVALGAEVASAAPDPKVGDEIAVD